MRIPTFVRQKYVDENGFLTPQVQSELDQFNIQLRNNFSEEGITIPSLTTNNINYISNPETNNSKPDGTAWYDSDTGQLKFKSNGVVKIIATL